MSGVATRNITFSQSDIASFCQRWNVRELALFGSVLRDTFDQHSDIDVLVVFQEGYTLDTLLDMKAELAALFGRDVDLIVKEVIEKDQNPYRRKSILDSAQVIYHAG